MSSRSWSVLRTTSARLRASSWLGGLTRAAVAAQMGISEHTVEQYLERAREKYARVDREAPTRIDLYREAQRDGVIDR